MNTLELAMVDTLKDLRDNYYVSGVKAEFEAEGTRIEEALRLKEIVTKAGLDLTIKIGGVEAIRDLYECRVIGVTRIVAPMCESPYALKKYLDACYLVFTPEERTQLSFLINVETITAVHAFTNMLNESGSERLNGVVLGRVDLTGSMGIHKDDVNDPRILDIAREVFRKASSRRMECVVGGGISAYSIPFLRAIPELDRYETRKVIFGCPEGLGDKAGEGILKAVGFELNWLKNKRGYYSAISTEDDVRIEMLERRYAKLIAEAGGAV